MRGTVEVAPGTAASTVSAVVATAAVAAAQDEEPIAQTVLKNINSATEKNAYTSTDSLGSRLS